MKIVTLGGSPTISLMRHDIFGRITFLPDDDQRDFEQNVWPAILTLEYPQEPPSPQAALQLAINEMDHAGIIDIVQSHLPDRLVLVFEDDDAAMVFKLRWT